MTLRLSENVLTELRVIALAHNRSLNGEILTALQEYIARYKQGLKPDTPNRTL